MKINFSILFPELRKATWKEVDLDRESRRYKENLFSPESYQAFVEKISRSYSCSFTYGGFLEDRSHLHKNQYNAREKKFIHLGVDFNVPENTLVTNIWRSSLFDVFDDEDTDGGWGRRVILKLEDFPLYAIYGHLKKDTLTIPNRIIEQGEVIGKVGSARENGNWYPHLHLQLANQNFIDMYKEDLKKLDGYAKEKASEIEHVINPVEEI